VIDDGDPIAEPFRFFHVMRRQQHRTAARAISGHDVPELQATLRIEPGRRLVEKQDVRLADERTRNGQPLLLTAGEFADARIPLLVEREVAQQLVGRGTAAIERAEERERLHDRELLGELRFLKRNADTLPQLTLVALPLEAENAHFAAVGRVEPLEDLDGRRLPRTVRTEQAETLAAQNFEIDPVDRLHVGIVLAQVAAGDDCVWFAHRRRNDNLRADVSRAKPGWRAWPEPVNPRLVDSLPMRAIVVADDQTLHLADVPRPVLGTQDVRIRVRATAVNRADLLQRAGRYPQPPGASPILGLECAGEVLEAGAESGDWTIGERVMALLSGGGYAEEAVVDAGSVMRVPKQLSDAEAGAFPEVFLTAFLNLFMLAEVRPGQKVLVHGGGSGVGTAATSLLKLAGATVFVTAGSDEKSQRCLAHGADVAINYRSEDFALRAQGMNVILDHIGARYLASNLGALAVDGRLVVIGSMGGTRTAELDLGAVLMKRLRIIGSTLRSRSIAEKKQIVTAFMQRFGTELETGRLRPVIHTTLPLERAAEAHALMDSSDHFGKIALTV
jgi:tumor protein p53-inducible protein 3